MQTIDRPNSPFTFPAREIVPTGWMRPVDKEEKTPFQLAKDNFVHWNRMLAECEKLWAEHVYNNPEFNLLDARQHRGMLYGAIGNGEILAVDFDVLQMPDETKSYISFIDEKLNELKTVLNEWHGNPDLREDIPQSFKDAMREYVSQETVDMEPDMFAQNATAEVQVPA